MSHLQYMPGDPRLVDQLVYELKSKGIFDQFRKECIADVDTRPAYQNLRQRVENSVSAFLARQCWKPDLNKNQLREKLRKHIMEGNYLEQGVERIVDQVVNPKVASVFIPQVEDLVYNYLGISRKKTVSTAETSNGKVSTEDLLPTDLEAVSPGSVKSNNEKDEVMDTKLTEEVKIDLVGTKDVTEDSLPSDILEKSKTEAEIQSNTSFESNDHNVSLDKKMSLPTGDIKLENIPAPENSPPKVEFGKIESPKESNIFTEIPLPDHIPLPKDFKEQYDKLHSDSDSSSDSSLRRNMSPLTPIRNYNNENSCDAQQGFEHDSDGKSEDKKEPSVFRFALDTKSTENSMDDKAGKKDETNLSYQFSTQVNINTFNTPMYDDSSNSNNLHIDYESDANSKNIYKDTIDKVPEVDHNFEDSKKDKKSDEKKSSHRSSYRSRDSHRHSSSKDKRFDSKQSSSRESSRHDKKHKDDHGSKAKSSHKERERSRDKSDKKDNRDSSKHRSSYKSSTHKDSKSHRSSSSSQRHSSKHSDNKKSSSSHREKEKSSDKSSDKISKDKERKDPKSSSHRSDRDKKSSSSSSKSKHDDKNKKKDKKDTDDHYSLSGRGNPNRRSTDRDSNDGSSSSKGSQNQTSSKTSETKKDSKDSSSKSDNTSTSGESASPSDKDIVINNASDCKTLHKPIRVENHLEITIASPPRLPFVPDVTLKKPKFAANLEEAKKMMRMRRFLDEEQKRMNQEAALLLEFQANVRPSLSQVYSSISGPELEFACIGNEVNAKHAEVHEAEHPVVPDNSNSNIEPEKSNVVDSISDKDVNKEDKNINDCVETQENTSSENLNVDKNETYNENKPFSQLVDEISEYSKACERNKNTDIKPDDIKFDNTQDEIKFDTLHDEAKIDNLQKDTKSNNLQNGPEFDNLQEEENKKRTEYFEVTIITEELSESEDIESQEDTDHITEIHKDIVDSVHNTEVKECDSEKLDEELHYFAEHEKYEAELKRHQYTDFLKAYTEKNSISDKIYLFNCDTYEENIIKEVSANFGCYEVINYYRNGHLTIPNTVRNVVKVSLASEITLPIDSFDINENSSQVFSPVKSECSFELSSDYDAKLEEMVNKTSRQEVLEIILGSIIDDKPTIDYCMESSIESSIESNASLKRKLEAECTVNNNRPILAPKIRKLSESDIISSTTEETDKLSNNNRAPNNTRSKYLGKARRIGLSRPRRANLPNSPSSDKSVENYEQNTPVQPPNGKMKSASVRNKVQRYDTSDLYKPKLHFLSRRNNIS